jgi:hypothetical protein
VSGRVIPLKLKPVPLGVICEIVRADPPVFVSFSATVELLPVVTFPKLRLVGLAANCPGRVPVPVDGTVRLGFDPLELIMRLPLTFPVVWGANEAVNVTL